jgi:hypothetical protein
VQKAGVVTAWGLRNRKRPVEEVVLGGGQREAETLEFIPSVTRGQGGASKG